MKALAEAVWRLCLLRLGPQDLPASSFLLGMATLFYVAVGVLNALAYFPFWRALGVSLFDTLMLAAFLQLGLRSVGHPARFTQSFTALALAWGVIGLFAVPLGYAFVAADNGGPSAFLMLFLMLTLVWSLAVMGHVLRHALDVSRGLGVAFAVAYFFLSQLLMEVLFPLASA
ncbi:MAG TPA: hypothetical protein ENJ05_05340 [Thiotrichales bacterium]|nr:hypothetical protein [Thiotrichales bacterium]